MELKKKKLYGIIIKPDPASQPSNFLTRLIA
jgi:hypothetical protein